MAAIPSTPPRKARMATCQRGGAKPHRKRAGMVKIVPEARDELADPIVWERFASRITGPRAWRARKSATVSTAMGIEVETVRPTRRPR